MARLILESIKKQAISEVSKFIEYKTLECYSRGWAYLPTNNAPESFKALKASTLGKIIPVADYGCNTSIYEKPEINIKFRFWHDVTHLELDEGFSVSGETSVIKCHLKEAKDYGLSPLAMEILEADTIGQVLYYNKYKEFVVNQMAFLDTCLQHGLSKALGFKH